ncbi:hypothetical protein [Paenibacillus aestuarii]|uniref:DUF2523 domain-containing protein n=1 Tax=Paenibacillus aestuarii TaxID=516965 RepID=A0ABW0KEP6_9BACL|nr:hypothetical protein [Paenibacillus aestuarii]
MTFALTGMMLYAMWVVLALMGLNFLMGLYNSFKASDFSGSTIVGFLQDLLFYVLPLFMLANMMSLDPTGWIIKIAYYVGAIGVALKYMAGFKK